MHSSEEDICARIDVGQEALNLDSKKLYSHGATKPSYQVVQHVRLRRSRSHPVSVISTLGLSRGRTVGQFNHEVCSFSRIIPFGDLPSDNRRVTFNEVEYSVIGKGSGADILNPGDVVLRRPYRRST